MPPDSGNSLSASERDAESDGCGDDRHEACNNHVLPIKVRNAVAAIAHHIEQDRADKY